MNDRRILRHTYSVCPICRKRIEACHIQRDGLIYMEKSCPEHGSFSTVVWRGLRDMDSWRSLADEISIEGGEDDCPNACGLCANHQSGTCCVLLEVTRRCNLNCPFCFAHGGEGNDRPLSDIVRDLHRLAIKGQTLVQLSGGEPTVRDDLPNIVYTAREAGCRYVQLNSNGVRLGEDLDYVKRLKDAGLSFVFMQFDGVDDSVNRVLRGQDLLELKCKAIENCGALHIGITLVPTIVPGVNDGQIGNILRFATERSPHVRGVHFQPVSYFGRTPKQPTDDMRYTLDQLLHDVDIQAADVLPTGTLYPSRCDHPLCGFHGDYVVQPDGTLYPLLSEHKGAKTATAAQNRSFVARRWDRSRNALGGRYREAGIAVLRGDWQEADSADRARKTAGNERRSASGGQAGIGVDCVQWTGERSGGCEPPRRGQEVVQVECAGILDERAAVSKGNLEANSKVDTSNATPNESRSAYTGICAQYEPVKMVGESVDCCCENTVGAYVRIDDDEEDMEGLGSVEQQGRGRARIDMTNMDVFLKRVRSHGFTVTAMAFQDAGNLDLERLKRCSLHVYHEGALIPFCKYYL